MRSVGSASAWVCGSCLASLSWGSGWGGGGVRGTAARWACGRWGSASSVGEMLDELEWPSLESRRERSSLTFFYK
ncbi:MAG: hypothetical protein ABW150_17755, partial [Candidatus Thiodiazotropha sp.]